MSQKLENSEDTAIREAFLEAVANGFAVSWQHINLLGEYDFSDEKLQNTVEIKPLGRFEFDSVSISVSSEMQRGRDYGRMRKISPEGSIGKQFAALYHCST